MAGVFITGTDTGVGKTWFSCLLLRSLRCHGVGAIGFKPVCCGDRDDAILLQEAAGGTASIDEVNPVWYRTPVAPAVAAEIEGGEVEVAALVEEAVQLADRHELVVAEGAGGWEVPLNRSESMSELACGLGWPVVLVVGNRLGALNHTLLTAAAVEAAGLALVGVVINHLAEERDVAMVSNESMLRGRLDVPCWASLMPGQDWLEPEFIDGLREILL